MLRLGLCCIFIEADIPFRTATIAQLRTKPDRLAHLSALVLSNLVSLQEAIRFCGEHGIGSFRINSQFCPGYTHEEMGYQLEDLSGPIDEEFERARQLAIEKEIRLTFHPDQFTLLNSPREEVHRNSLRELAYHAELCDRLGADVICLHGGGVYGDREAALTRLSHNIGELPDSIRSRLALENDDRSYSPSDLLPVCEQMEIPLIYDVHHHRCHPDSLSEEVATEAALATWNREPLFHISSPKPGNNPRAHDDYINVSDWPESWRQIPDLTVEVEAKAKEKAVLKLAKDLQAKEKRAKG